MDFIAKPSLLVDSVIFLDCTAADKLARSSLCKKILYTWMASYSASKKERSYRATGDSKGEAEDLPQQFGWLLAYPESPNLAFASWPAPPKLQHAS